MLSAFIMFIPAFNQINQAFKIFGRLFDALACMRICENQRTIQMSVSQFRNAYAHAYSSVYV